MSNNSNNNTGSIDKLSIFAEKRVTAYERELVFESKLGNFNYYQERILVFFRSKTYLMLVVLFVLQMLLNIYSLKYVFEIPTIPGYDYVVWVIQVVTIFITVISMYFPISLVWIRISSMKCDVRSLHKALGAVEIMIIIGLVFMWLGVVGTGIIVLRMLFLNIVAAVVFGLISWLMYKILHIYLQRFLDFIVTCRINVIPQVLRSKPTPHPEELRVFVIVGLVFSILGLFNYFFGLALIDQRNIEVTFQILPDSLAIVSYIFGILIMMQYLFAISKFQYVMSVIKPKRV